MAVMQEIRYLTGPPDAFFIQLKDQLPHIEQMENDLRHFYQDPANQQPVNRVAEIGAYYGTRINGDKYVRVRVDEFLGEEDVVVMSIDFGLQEIMTIEDLVGLPPQWQCQPPFAVCCRLSGIGDPDLGMDPDSQATLNTFETFMGRASGVFGCFLPLQFGGPSEPQYEVNVVLNLDLLVGMKMISEVNEMNSMIRLNKSSISVQTDTTVIEASVQREEEEELDREIAENASQPAITDEVAKTDEDREPTDEPKPEDLEKEATFELDIIEEATGEDNKAEGKCSSVQDLKIEDNTPEGEDEVTGVKEKSELNVKEWLDHRFVEDKPSASTQKTAAEPLKKKVKIVKMARDLGQITLVKDSLEMVQFLYHKVESTDKFYIHPYNPEIMESFEEMSRKMEEHYADTETEDWESLIPLNCLVAVFCSDDGKWYRAELLEFLDKGAARVNLVDYPEELKVEGRDIRPLEDQFTEIPRIVITCRLADFEPLSESKAVDATKLMEELGHLGEGFHIAHCPDDAFDAEGVVRIDPIVEDTCLSALLIQEGLGVIPKAKTEAQEVVPVETPGWNPMASDYRNMGNIYTSDGEYVDLLNQTVIEDKRKICKFYQEGKRNCFRGDNCQFLHVHTGNSHPDSGFMTVSFHELTPPAVGSTVYLQVTSSKSPTNFFAVMPWGPHDFDSDVTSQNRMALEEENLQVLNQEMTRHYSRDRFSGRQLRFQPTEIVAAFSREDKLWLRARFLGETSASSFSDSFSADDEYSDPGSGPSAVGYLVQFVDFGDHLTVLPSEIRRIENRFLQLPFQAFQCSLVGIEPNTPDGIWSEGANEVFSQLTLRRSFAAKVINVAHEVVEVELVSMAKGEKEIGKVLVRRGFARSYKPERPDTDGELDISALRVPG